MLHDPYAAGVAAKEAGRYAEAYRLLRPLADAGHAEAQAHVGCLMACGLHRSEGYDKFQAGPTPATDEATARADRDQGGRFLKAASAAGIGAASFNLAGLVVMGFGGGSWEERKARAAELYALAYAQGFTAFGGLMRGDGPGQPYLGILERYAASTGRSLPGESRHRGGPGT